MKPTTVFIIDDSKFDLLIASELLLDHCDLNDIHCLTGAQEALDRFIALENTPGDVPDIIFLDIRMPGMDGFEFLEAYAKLPKSLIQNCKLYMVSSSLDPSDIQKAKNNPFVIDFLEKPLEETFLKTLFNKQ